MPSQIGRFEVKAVLGSGAMGVVLRAHDPQLDRDVAIKVIKLPENLRAGQIERMKTSLLQEARTAAQLQHPSIVQVYDVGEQDDQPYIVLELIDGAPLSDVLPKQGVLDHGLACRIVTDVLEGMAYAHDQGIVHLDLKPANIMIQKDHRARVMDFGIARTLADLAKFTETLSGTPRYMSPEQIQAQPLDTRSDVFSLGSICYSLFCGRHPFPQKNYEELRQALAQQPHPPPQILRPDLSPPLCDFINRALSKKASDRFPSARQMLERFSKTGAAAGEVRRQDRHEVFDFILQRIQRKGDFPTISQHVSAVTRAARSRSSSVQRVSEEILKDVSLTNRVLRMVNSSFYQGGAGQVTTVSRAVVLLGMDAVLNLAAGLAIIEHFAGRSDVEHLKRQALRAMFTGLNASGIAREMGLENSEECFICGMLNYLGRLIVAFYFPEEMQAIEDLKRTQDLDDEKASRRVMRISYRELGQTIAEHWKLPDTVLGALQGLPNNHRGKLLNKREQLQGITAYAFELSEVNLMPDEEQRQAALTSLVRKYDGKINISEKKITALLKNSVKYAWATSHTLRENLRDLGLEPPAEDGETADGVMEVTGDASAAPERQTQGDDHLDESDSQDEQTISAQRRDVLMRTIGEISMTLTGDFELNDVLMMVLEGMYRGLGFQNVLLAMVTPQKDRLVCRFGFGAQRDELDKIFDLPLTAESGLVTACLQRKEEIILKNMTPGEPFRGIPRVLIDCLKPSAILMIPMVVQQKPLGLYFVNRAAGQPPTNAQDEQNMRTLVSQSILAINQKRLMR